MKHFGFWRTASAAAVMMGLAGCAAGADAEEPQPTVLETPPNSPGDGGGPASPDVNGGDPDDDSPEDSEPTPVPASSDGPAQNWPAPDPPDEIYEPTEEGAEALLQYWFDARHYARITGDTKPLEEVSHEDCAMCDGHIDQIEEVHPAAWFVEEEADLVIDSYVRLESSHSASGLFAIRSAAFEAYKDGDLEAEDAGGRESGFGIGLMFQGDHWQVHDLSYLAEYDDAAIEEWEDRDD